MYNRYNVCAKLHAHSLFFEPMTGFEPVTSSLPRKRSTPELHRPFSFYRSWAISSKFRAGDRVRTGDIQLGRLTLYQLSYSRISSTLDVHSLFQFSGESRIRTCEGKNQQIYSLSSLAAWVSPRHFIIWDKLPTFFMSRWRDSNPRPADYKSAALASWATPA